MRTRCCWAILSAALVVTPFSAQEKNEKNEQTTPSARQETNAIEVRFADESTVKMNLQTASIDVVTRYGKLTIPANEIRRIDFGLRIPEETLKRIDTAITQLGGKDFKQREAACAELTALRELAYPAVQKASRSNDPEVAKRAKEILKAITEAVPEEKLHPARHDTVVTLDFTVTGHVDTAELKARGNYFGEVTLKLSDLRTLRVLALDKETPVLVDASKHGGQMENWMETGLAIRAGTGLRIIASGMVDLKPGGIEGGTLTVGPDGQGSRFTRPAGGGFGGGGGGRGPRAGGGGPVGGFDGRGTTGTGTPQPGMLIARIGENGRVFIVGSRYEGTPSEEGKLYLRIVPNTTNSESSGSYDVRVSLGR
jgi:hypothetical protein